MNLKHAQYMLTVLQEGSITSAAKKIICIAAFPEPDD